MIVSHGESLSPLKASCDRVALPKPSSITSLAYAVFLRDHTTGCGAYSFTADGCGRVLVRFTGFLYFIFDFPLDSFSFRNPSLKINYFLLVNVRT